MKNDQKFFYNALRSQSSRHYNNIFSARTRKDSNKKIFLSKTKFIEQEKKNNSNRYTIKHNQKMSLSPSVIKNKNKIYKSIEINKANNNRKSFTKNKSKFEYNEIISLLDKILDKANSFDILVKIKHFINKLIDYKSDNKKNLMNSKSCEEFFSSEETKNLTSKNKSQRTIKFNKENKEKKDSDNDRKINLKDKYDKTINDSYINRRVNKLYNKINLLEEKNNIEQLKYLFFIVEQEKKIAELEKNFELNEIPLDKRIIEKMKDLKCYPAFIREGFNTIKYKSSFKENIDQNVNTSLKSRNKKELKKNYSFDKDIEPIPRKNQSLIMNKSEKRPKSGKLVFNRKKNDFNQSNINKKYNNSDYKINKIVINFSRPVNQFFNKKNFFITHPKLNYVKDSLEKNHYLKLKTKEQLSGDTNLLSNMNLASKSQKIAVNDFSSFINNSMANFEKFKH